jgi:hypothetical protein
MFPLTKKDIAQQCLVSIRTALYAALVLYDPGNNEPGFPRLETRNEPAQTIFKTTGRANQQQQQQQQNLQPCLTGSSKTTPYTSHREMPEIG